MVFSESHPCQGQVIPVSSHFSLKRKFNLQLQRKPWYAYQTFYKFYIKCIQASDLYYNYYCIIYIFHDFKFDCMFLERSFWWFLNTQVGNCHFPLKIKIQLHDPLRKFWFCQRLLCIILECTASAGRTKWPLTQYWGRCLGKTTLFCTVNLLWTQIKIFLYLVLGELDILEILSFMSCAATAVRWTGCHGLTPVN